MRCPLFGLDTLGQDSTQLPPVGFEVVGPTNADRWAADAKLIQGLDHRDGRRQCEPGLVGDRQAMDRRVDGRW